MDTMTLRVSKVYPRSRLGKIETMPLTIMDVCQAAGPRVWLQLRSPRGQLRWVPLSEVEALSLAAELGDCLVRWRYQSITLRTRPLLRGNYCVRLDSRFAPVVS